MGDVFCLVILQTGNRRKLKLATGTYAELVEKLAGLVELDLENTLIQMFDADLDDFVDLVPEDDIPNKAKLRVISRSASALCNAAVAPCGQKIVPTCPRDLYASKAASVRGQVDVLLRTSDEGTQEVGNHAMDTSEPVRITQIRKERVTCSDAAVQTGTASQKNTRESMVDVKRIQDALRELLPLRQEGSNNEMATGIANVSPAVTRDLDDHLKFMLPRSFGVWCDAFLETKRPITKRVRTHMISVLFKACYKITLYPTARLYEKVLDLLVVKYPHVVEGKYSRCRWSVALKSRFKVVRRKLVRASAIVKKAQEMRALGQVLDNPSGEHDYTQAEQAFASQKSLSNPSANVSECEDMSGQEEEECGNSQDTDADTADTERSLSSEAVPSDSVEVHLMPAPMECPEKTGPSDDEGLMDCPDYSDAVLEDITVSELLGMCNSEAASEVLIAQKESQALPIKIGRCYELAKEASHQECDPSLTPEEHPEAPVIEPDCGVLAPISKAEEQAEVPSHKSDCVVPSPRSQPEEQADETMNNSDSVAFELPSFGIFDNLLHIQVPVNFMMQRHILHGLFEALTKTTLCPTKEQIKKAVDSLIEKYPHLSNIKGNTGKEFWMNALMDKFPGHRSTLADSIPTPQRPRRSCVAKRKSQPDQNGSPQRFLRPLCIEEQPSENKDEVRQQGKSRASAAAGGGVDNREREQAALERHGTTSEMTVEEIISVFPVFREESSLLEEFRVLWNTDIADCFEEGIKKLFLVLMNCGTHEEIQAISQPGNDILLVVLNAIARRCGEQLNSVLVKGNAPPTSCLVKRSDTSIDVFFDGSRLFVASSLLGGLCSLFASFWLFQKEYSTCMQGIMTFLEHAFLNLNHTTPGARCRRFINLYRRVADIDSHGRSRAIIKS